VEVNNSLTISASASDSDGTISKVEFYAGSTLLESDQSEPYSYAWTPATAGDYNLTAKAYDDKGDSKTSTAVSITVNSPPASVGPALLITEVSSAQYSNTPKWFEVYNSSNQSLNLSNYSLRVSARDSEGYISSTKFTAPSLTIEPQKYAIVRYKPSSSEDLFDGPSLVHFGDTGSETISWGEYGAIEISDNSDNSIIDYVQWGVIHTYNPSENPSTASEWSGDPATAMPAEEGYVLVRDKNNTDTNSASDWTLRGFGTPGAINDVISDTDADGDGIPDDNEAEGKTYCGLPYYDWGARSGQKDIFVHIDYMNPDDAPKPLAVTPRQAALQRIVTAFENRGIAIHFDVGNIFGTSVSDYCLENKSHSVTYTELLDLSPSSGAGSAYYYKAQNFPISRLPIFHYCLMGYKPNGSFSGLGEIDGNDFIITLGNANFETSSQEQINYMNFSHAATIMHELGHNLGLEHGGDVETNYKPNYVSIMNYMYSNYGLPATGNSQEGDRYYYYRFSSVDGSADTSNFNQYFPQGWWIDLHNDPYEGQGTMDYSDGSGGSLDERSLNESDGLNRSGSAPVDFNGNGSTSDSSFAFDLNNDGTNEVISDYNDWTAISANFSKYISGVASIRPSSVNNLPPKQDWLADDYQRVVPCDPTGICRHKH
ncbi:MAG: Ig-like domain-containing protein, partial [Candidatus Rifleibacteriota bacterium]